MPFLSNYLLFTFVWKENLKSILSNVKKIENVGGGGQIPITPDFLKFCFFCPSFPLADVLRNENIHKCYLTSVCWPFSVMIACRCVSRERNGGIPQIRGDKYLGQSLLTVIRTKCLPTIPLNCTQPSRKEVTRDLGVSGWVTSEPHQVPGTKYLKPQSR